MHWYFLATLLLLVCKYGGILTIPFWLVLLPLWLLMAWLAMMIFIRLITLAIAAVVAVQIIQKTSRK